MNNMNNMNKYRLLSFLIWFLSASAVIGFEVFKYIEYETSSFIFGIFEYFAIMLMYRYMLNKAKSTLITLLNKYNAIEFVFVVLGVIYSILLVILKFTIKATTNNGINHFDFAFPLLMAALTACLYTYTFLKTLRYRDEENGR
jgi:hypothetical protein